MQAYSYRDDPAVPSFPDDRPVLIFDGLCVLCSSGAKLVLRLDRKGRFRMTPAQSALGRALYRHYGMDESGDASMLLLKKGKLHLRSDASIRVCETLGGLWRVASLLRLVPRLLRDWGYDWLALHRYHLFGQRKVCFRPKPAWAERFLA